MNWRPAVLVAAMLGEASIAAPLPAAATRFASVSPAPDAEAFRTDCMRGRSVQTCVCMAEFLQRSGEGQFVLEMAIVDAKAAPRVDPATVLARHGIAPGDGRAIARAGKAMRKVALGACR